MTQSLRSALSFVCVLAGRGDPTSSPAPDEDEIEWLLAELSKYLSDDVRVRRSDVLSAWKGNLFIYLFYLPKYLFYLPKYFCIYQNIFFNRMATVGDGSECRCERWIGLERPYCEHKSNDKYYVRDRRQADDVP